MKASGVAAMPKGGSRARPRCLKCACAVAALLVATLLVAGGGDPQAVMRRASDAVHQQLQLPVRLFGDARYPWAGDAEFDVEADHARRNEAEKRPLPPKTNLPAELDTTLRERNTAYHAKRAQLRAEQTERHVGPLREHTFFTVDCTDHSLWQAMALEHSWTHVHSVRGGGFLSRLVSGCGDERRFDRLANHVLPSAEIDNRAAREKAKAEGVAGCHRTADDGCFGIFYAPVFNKLPSGEVYAPFNRPNGIWFWFNHSDLTEDVYILTDPDMVYLSRLRGSHLVRPGAPAAMYYEYMDRKAIGEYSCPLCPEPGSFERRAYAVGPPWMIAHADMKRLLPTWVALVPMLRAIDKTAWIVEMVAYSIACAFHGLPHQLLLRSMADSNAFAPSFDGPYVAGHRLVKGTLEHTMFTKGPAGSASPMRKDGERWFTTASAANIRRRAAGLPGEEGPFRSVSMLHYCYTWEVGELNPQEAHEGTVQHRRAVERDQAAATPYQTRPYFHWSKYRTPTDWPGGSGRFAVNLLSCKAPLLQEFHSRHAINMTAAKDDPNRALMWHRFAHMLHLGLPAINEAIVAWKRRYCISGSDDGGDERVNLEQRLRTTHPSYFVSERPELE